MRYFDIEKLKKNNPYLHHYKTTYDALITDHNNICVLLEKASRYELKSASKHSSPNLVQDFLDEIVLALFDTHFKDSNVYERHFKIIKMFEKSYSNARNFYEDESENA